jgi:hypothetical protein
VFGFHFANADGAAVFGFNRTLSATADEPNRLVRGQRVRIAGKIDNPLLPGRYFVTCLVSRDRPGGDMALHVLRLLSFVVYGTSPGPGIVSVPADVEARVEPWQPR